MRLTHCLAAVLIAASWLVTPLASQSRPDRIAARIDSVAKAAIASKATPSISIALSRRGRTVYSKAFGTADLEQRVIATPNTVYLIGSVTKQFTAAAVLTLVEDGKLSLDDQLGKFFPDWPAAGRGVTVRQLLNHTSGIKDYTTVPRWLRVMALPLPHDSMLALFRDEPMDFAPGTEWRYDNSGYYLLGVIIEKASGRTYAEYLARRLFEPAGLRATRYCASRSVVPSRTPGCRTRRLHECRPDQRGPGVCGRGALLHSGRSARLDPGPGSRPSDQAGVIPNDDDSAAAAGREESDLWVWAGDRELVRPPVGLPQRRHQRIQLLPGQLPG